MSREPGVPSVAVLLATYNGEAYIAEQIESIAGQEKAKITIFIRDDYSTDRTLEIVERYIKKSLCEIITVDKYPKKFGSGCGNFLSLLAEFSPLEFDYFAFSDQDDIWLPGKLSRAVGQLRSSRADAYASNLTYFFDTTNVSGTLLKFGLQRRFDHLFQSASAGCTYVLTAGAARLIASRAGPIEATDWREMSHDWLSYAISRSHGLQWLIDDWSGIKYRQHSANLYGAMRGFRGFIKKLKLVRTGWYRRNILKNRPFLDQKNYGEMTVLDRLERFNFFDRIWLACRVRHFRREPSAQFLLAIFLIFKFI